MKENTKNDRREFLKKVGAVAAFGAFATSFAAVINSCEQDQVVPAPPIKDPETVDVDLNQFPILATAGNTASTRVTLKDGSKQSIYIHRIDATTFSVFDPTCRHMGCTVNLPESGADIVCPCHDVHFSPIDGSVKVKPIPDAVPSLKTFKVFKFDATTNTLKILM